MASNLDLNLAAKYARIFDSAGNEILSAERVPLLQNAAGRWPPSLLRDEVYYDYDEILSTANDGIPCYKQRTVS